MSQCHQNALECGMNKFEVDAAFLFAFERTRRFESLAAPSVAGPARISSQQSVQVDNGQ